VARYVCGGCGHGYDSFDLASMAGDGRGEVPCELCGGALAQVTGERPGATGGLEDVRRRRNALTVRASLLLALLWGFGACVSFISPEP